MKDGCLYQTAYSLDFLGDEIDDGKRQIGAGKWGIKEEEMKK